MPSSPIMNYIWDERMAGGRYRYADTGRLVSERTLAADLKVIQENTAQRFADLAREFVGKQGDPGVFENAMRQEIKNIHLSSFALGIGGTDQLTPEHLRGIKEDLVKEYRALTGFISDIMWKEMPPDAAATRAALYASNAYGQFWAASDQRKMDGGFNEERVINPGDPCPICQPLVDAGWVEVGTQQVPVHLNCQCEKIYRKNADKVTENLSRQVREFLPNADGEVNEDEIREWLEKSFGEISAEWKSEQDDEVRALNLYAGASYGDINRTLREGLAPTEQIKKTIDNLKSLSGKFSAPEDFIAYRGAVVPELQDAISAGQDLTGIVFADKAFASTTLDQGITRGFTWKDGSVLMKIEVPKGSNLIPKDAILPSQEHEIILPAGSRFQITSQTKTTQMFGSEARTITQINVKLVAK